MFFQSLAFGIFFAVVAVIYWSLRTHRARMLWLLIASIGFYLSWGPWLITLILFSASVDYLVALRLEAVRSPAVRRGLLCLSIGTNLGLLAFFKYTNFLLGTASTTMGWFGWHWDPPLLHVLLPLGISFYTFETISYIVEVYLGRYPPVRSPLDYALYIMFFPHLIAGPIVRPRDFLPQLGRSKRLSWNRVCLGLQYFLMGLFKKAVIADTLATVVDPVFKTPAVFGSGAVWLAVLGYAVQIYCDFSGYSDMAIGCAHALGFKLPANFNMPYLAANVSEFWRRWHISLSSWLRDYLYIPLGGSRGGRWATYRNLLVTMVLGGIWHGASWTFAAWGLYHGLLLAAHRALPKPRWLAGAGRPIAVAFTFLTVAVGWVFFRAQSFGEAGVVLSRMFWPTEGEALAATTAGAAIACLALTVFCHALGAGWSGKFRPYRLPAPVLGAAMVAVLLLVQVLMPDSGKVFIYFRF